MGLAISSLSLGNGLRVVLVKDPHATEVQVTMRYRVGSVDDPAEHPGMAHLVEHLMFQQVLGSQTLFAHLERAATFFNGFTSFDATTYISRAHPSRLDELLSVEAVRVGFRCTSITDSAFTREREVVVNELKWRDETTMLFGALHAAAYPAGHPYRDFGASIDAVRAITRDQACAFADAHYAPGNAVLVISGNVEEQHIVAALGKFLGRIARREVTAPSPVPVVALEARAAEAPAPIDKDALLVAWPLPVEPQLRLKVMAFAGLARGAIDSEIKGRVTSIELGDERAPMLAFVVQPDATESMQDVIDGVHEGLLALSRGFDRTVITAFDELGFDLIQQTAVYNQYAALENTTDRDPRLAAYVAAGFNPRDAVEAQFRALRDLSHEDGASIAAKYFSYDHATVVTLKAAGKKRGHAIAVAPPIHDQGIHRAMAAPEQAHRAAESPAAPTLAMKTRVLGNGLKIVLLPITSVPTIDIRLIFAAGTADEPTEKRGSALAAGYSLTWDWHHANDVLRFLAAGGRGVVDVGPDSTTFDVQGINMHIDLLLAGLRRWVRDGRYSDDFDGVGEAVRRQRKAMTDDDALLDAWRQAVFGAQHPYVQGGLVRFASEALDVEDAARFRKAYYTPDNATLVIAGNFDARLADRWIDYLFEDWQGHAEPRQAPRVALQPASIAKIEDLAQLGLHVAMPAEAADRAHRLVAAEMLADIVGDVRHQLGASYGVEVALAETRLASEYLIIGWIEVGHATAAVQLIRDRITELHTSADATARAFVSARDRVLTHLVSVAGSAASLGARVGHDVELSRTPLSDLQLAATVQSLTVDDMAATLAELDLARATVMMRGPASEVRSAFGALGRQPTEVHLDPAAKDALDDPLAKAKKRSRHKEEEIHFADLAEPITEQAEVRRQGPLAITVIPGVALASLVEGEGVASVDTGTGVSIDADVGYRFTARNAVGLHLGVGTLQGNYRLQSDVIGEYKRYTLVPIDIDALFSAVAYDRLWGAVFLGAHLDQVTMATTTSSGGLGAGIEGGVDLIGFGRHRLGIAARLGGVLGSSSGYGGVSFGIAYRQ